MCSVLEEDVLHGDCAGEHMRVSVLKGATALSESAGAVKVVLQTVQIPQTTDHRGRVSLAIIVTRKAQGLWFSRK